MLPLMAGGKPLVWLHGEVKTPPFSRTARVETGFLLRRLQNVELIEMPVSRPMPVIGANCHELRVDDGDVTWRLLYHVEPDAIVILDIFQKKSRTTPKRVIDVAQKRLRAYQRAIKEN
jgi:phage-related protein